MLAVAMTAATSRLRNRGVLANEVISSLGFPWIMSARSRYGIQVEGSTRAWLGVRPTAWVGGVFPHCWRAP